jgi:hypothetical protein
MKKTLLTLALVAMTAVASFAQGTIQFNNGTLTRVTYKDASGVSLGNLPTAIGVVYGVFVNGSDTPVQPLGNNQGVNAGIINASGLYPIPGTAENQVVSLQVRGWSASFGNDWQAASRTAGALFGETDVRNVTLGLSTAAPAVIWQTATGTATDKFKPLVLLTVVPEPSTIALAVLGLGSLLLFRRRK